MFNGLVAVVPLTTESLEYVFQVRHLEGRWIVVGPKYLVIRITCGLPKPLQARLTAL